MPAASAPREGKYIFSPRAAARTTNTRFYSNNTQDPDRTAAQVLNCRGPAPRTNKVVQEEAGGLLYALLFVLW